MAKKPANKLRLKSVTIDGFKSLRGVTIPFDDRATVLIGPNGSGKSTVLQALEFAWYFANGRFVSFFSDHGSLPSQFFDLHKTVDFSFEFSFNSEDVFIWEFSISLQNHGLKERLVLKDSENKVLIERQEPRSRVVIEPGRPPTRGERLLPMLKGTTSFFSYLTDDDFEEGPLREWFVALQSWMEGAHFFGILESDKIKGVKQIVHSPQDMTFEEIHIDVRGLDRIGATGEHVASFISSLNDIQQRRLANRISKVIPQISDVGVRRISSNAVELFYEEVFPELRDVRSAQVSDGTLRITALAALAELPESDSFISIDEVENGIDPHIVEKLIRSVVHDCDQQFLFTSHSPDLVNHFGADQIVVLARDDDGRTLAAPMSAMPRAVKSMKYAGPAVIWTGASLKTLSRWVKEASKEPVASP